MINQLLLSNRWKILGWVLFIPSLIAGVFLTINDFESTGFKMPVFAIISDKFLGKAEYFTWIESEIAVTIVGVIFIIGALLICFSREKNEDEFIAETRLNSLQWAVLINYILLLLAFIFVYGTVFLTVIVYGIFTTLLIFIIRFHYLLYKNNLINPDEKQN
ncbi:MAG: hypothetical protein HOP11_05410 [Saprospiraceae bacterium]|nr:hypothetical protein [Saprospiraceae bacterium]